MGLLWCATRVAALCLLLSGLASSQIEPLCESKRCGNGVCRVVQTCTAANVCTLSAQCLPAEYENRYAYGCRVGGKPLLKRAGSGPYSLRTCYAANACPDGFYCSAELQDVSSRCCRAHIVPEQRNGTCPVPESRETIFCVDECLSDADCYGPLKCCQKSQECTRKLCRMPDPCSIKNCPSGTQCVVDPNYNAHCLSTPVDPVTTTPSPPPPPQRNNNNNNNNNNAGRGSLPGGFRNPWDPVPLRGNRWNESPFLNDPYRQLPSGGRNPWDPIPPGRNGNRGLPQQQSCPPLLYPVNWDVDCHVRNRCVIGNPFSCPPAKSCCPSYYCGFICRSPYFGF